MNDTIDRRVDIVGARNFVLNRMEVAHRQESTVLSRLSGCVLYLRSISLYHS